VKLFTRAEWEALIAETEPNTNGRKMSLSEFAVLFNEKDAARWQKYPGVNFSNLRWVSHLEQALSKGMAVPDEILRDVKPTEELRYDSLFFPFLNEGLVSVSKPTVV